MGNKVYILKAYDYEDGRTTVIASMDLDDKNRSASNKAYALQEFLVNHYAAWLDQFKDDKDEMSEHLEEIYDVAKRLTNKDGSGECCGYCLFWDEIDII